MFGTLKNLQSELKQTGMLLGGLLLVLLLFTIVSGIILALFYSTAPEETYRSMVAISEQPFTAFVRNFHFWATDLLIFTLFLHITRVALTKPSGKPRRYAWWIGVGLLFLVGAEMLLGTFLRGDQEALEAYTHFFVGTTGIVADYLPFVTALTDFFSGHATLFRFFIFHAILVPLSIMSLIVLHALFAPSFRGLIAPWKKVSDATIRGELSPQPGFWTTPSVRKLGLLTLCALCLIVVLAFALPAPLMSAPHGGMEVTKTPWWVLWVVAIENVFGLNAMLIAPIVLFAIFIAIPLFSRDRSGADWGVYGYLTTIALLLALGFWGALAEQVPHTEMFMEGMTM